MANTTQKMNLRRVKTVIKTVKLVQKKDHEELKITTENGTRCTISSQEENYKCFYRRWKSLCHCLSAGDKVEVVSGNGKIIRCAVDFTDRYFSVVAVQENEEGLFLNCHNQQSDVIIEIQKSYIERKNIICENEEGVVLDWKEICHFSESAAKTGCIMLQVFYLDKKIRCIHFLET